MVRTLLACALVVGPLVLIWIAVSLVALTFGGQ
jgi:hypothetical protein